MLSQSDTYDLGLVADNRISGKEYSGELCAQNDSSYCVKNFSFISMDFAEDEDTHGRLGFARNHDFHLSGMSKNIEGGFFVDELFANSEISEPNFSLTIKGPNESANFMDIGIIDK